MDYSRQRRLLDPSSIRNRTISIIGAGATGSHIALMLAQLGWGDYGAGQGKMRVFDGDVVESHNLANQAFYPDHIGKSKVESIQDVIMSKCGFKIEARNEMVTKDTDRMSVCSNYVFLLTDTMSSRKEIFENHLKYSFNTNLVIETRMGLRDGRIYAFNPNDQDHIEAWEETLYDDDDAEDSVCGASSSIITTAMYLSSLAVQRLIHHFDQNGGEKNLQKDPRGYAEMWNEVHFTLLPECFYMRRFGENKSVLTEV